MSSEDLISQFMVFTGCLDGERAQQYLEMSNMNVETAVGLYMEHVQQGSASSGIGLAPHEIRAPDQTRTMRLMDDVGLGGSIGHDVGLGGLGGYANAMDDHDIVMSAFSHVDARAAVNAAAAADDDSATEEPGPDQPATRPDELSANLSDMFAPPTHLVHRGGGFQGARAVARDARRWLLVNIQRDSEFACHALNRDVWRDELVENLVREGFIFWQANHDSSEGQTYVERYKVYDYPHLAIIDPRTGRSLWKKEGWTQEKPFTAERFAEMAMDFCSRHSFDKAPLPPKNSRTNGNGERKRPFMSEEEQMQAAVAASLKQEREVKDKDDDEYVMDEDDSDDEIECLGTSEEKMASCRDEEVATEEQQQSPTWIDILLATEVGNEPTDGARLQLRMPDATRIVRKFVESESVQKIYAFVAQNNMEAKAGKEFVLMAGFPPKNLEAEMENTINSCGLNGQAVTVRWKD